jgi:hypothetical protein
MRFVTLLAMLFVAVPAYGQDTDAERLYRAMEKKVRSTKTLHLAFNGQITMMGMCFASVESGKRHRSG